MTETEFGEHAKIAAVSAMKKLSDESVEYYIATMGSGAEFKVIVKRRPGYQIAERQQRKDRGERLF